jgi:heparin/heparan-sulfate lyase
VRDVAELLVRVLNSQGGWWELESLRALLGSEARFSKALGYDFGPDPRRPEYAFLATDVTAAYGGMVRDAKRSFVFLNLGAQGIAGALVTFDLIVTADTAQRVEWLIQDLEKPELRGSPFSGDLRLGERKWRLESRTLSSKRASAETLFLNLLQFVDPEAATPLPAGEVSSVELAGVRLADRVVLFHADTTSARGAVSFSVTGDGTLKYLVTGLAPGTWEVWWNGWLEDPQGFVDLKAGALYFQGPAGSYFLRRRGV